LFGVIGVTELASGTLYRSQHFHMRVLAALLVCSIAAPAAAQVARTGAMPPPRFTDPERVTKLRQALPEIDRLMRAFADSSHVPGIAYGVIVDGKLLYAGTAGLREVPSGARVDTGTVFRIASMTKSFTALAILKLRDEGRLSLEDPAERYVPELRSLRYPTTDAPKITIRHLLSHSAGWPEDNPWGDQQLAATDADLSRMITAGIPFSTAPGTAYEYSNYGFAILGRIVANVAGMPYTRYLTERILRPLGMTSTTMEAARVPARRLAHGYRRQDGAWLEEPPLPDGAFGAMGGMLTSVADLARWVAFQLDGWPARDGPETGPVRRASVREMQQVARFSGGSAVRNPVTGDVALSAGGYGYGLGVRQTCAFRISVAHSGGLPGFGSQMRWLPDYGVGIVAMGNLTYTSWGAVVERALEALARTGGLEPRSPTPAPALVERREQVTRLIAAWNDALADSLAAMNLYLDESKDRRRTALAALTSSAGGDCRNDGPFEVENALRGRWRMRCAGGALQVSITLAPTESPGVQYLEVVAMKGGAGLEPPKACR
jgi:CubicO group peptidase (beta-lactamase class C family)